MQIIGHELIEYEKLNFIKEFDESLGLDNFVFHFDENLIELCKKNSKNFSVFTKSKSEAVLANALGAKFIFIYGNFSSDSSEILAFENLTKEIVELAEFYLFDSKVVMIVKNFSSDLERAIKLGVDGVVLEDAILGEFNSNS